MSEKTKALRFENGTYRDLNTGAIYGIQRDDRSRDASEFRLVMSGVGIPQVVRSGYVDEAEALDVLDEFISDAYDVVGPRAPMTNEEREESAQLQAETEENARTTKAVKEGKK